MESNLFGVFVKTRLAKFNELINDKFMLHLKECEFRFNNRHINLLSSIIILIFKTVSYTLYNNIL